MERSTNIFQCLKTVFSIFLILIITMVSVTGCTSNEHTFNTFSPENLMENALGKTDAQVEEALGVTLEWPDPDTSFSLYPTVECSVPFGDETADAVVLEFAGGPGTELTSFSYQFSSLETPEEYWDFLKGLAEQSRKEGLKSALDDYYGPENHPVTFADYNSYDEFEEAMEKSLEGPIASDPIHGVEDRFFADDSTYVVYSMTFTLGIPQRMGIAYVSKDALNM